MLEGSARVSRARSLLPETSKTPAKCAEHLFSISEGARKLEVLAEEKGILDLQGRC